MFSKKMFVRIFLPYLLLVSAVWLINQQQEGVAVALVPALFFYVSLGCMRYSAYSFSWYGLTVQGWQQAVLSAVLLIPVVLVPFFLLMQVPVMQAWFAGGGSGTVNFVVAGKKIFHEFWFVSVPEELFFRGYIQTNLGLLLKTTTNQQQRHGKIIFYSAGFFAVAHLVTLGNPGGLLTFFPGLLFAWLRERTGSLLSSALFHSFCNLTVFFLQCS